MNRIDNSRFLLYMEPKKEEKFEIPLNDGITEIMKLALSEAQIGIANYYEIDNKEKFEYGLDEDGHPIHYYGFHETDCGVWSTCVDYLLKNDMITNSLSVFYLQYYRDSIPKSEMDKVMKLVLFYDGLYQLKVKRDEITKKWIEAGIIDVKNLK